MKVIGIDIGTTTVSAVLTDDTGRVIDSRTRKNTGFLPAQYPWEKLQNPNDLASLAQSLVLEFLAETPDVAGIGITGQQHGIVYVDKSGNAISPLYTWQDARGLQPLPDGSTACRRILEQTGFHVPSGYGLATHLYNMIMGLVPENTDKLCTIGDYIAMKLAGLHTPSTTPSHAHALGLYDLEANRFSPEALQALGIDSDLLPSVEDKAVLACRNDSIRVSRAIGDNQASFIGATAGKNRGVLLNVGTGSQVSVFSPHPGTDDTLETRPFPGGGYLLVGATLCGGRAYALLEQYFRQTVQLVTQKEVDSCYDAMAAILNQEKPEHIPEIQPFFAGTRKNPGQTAKITGLAEDNFTPRHMVWAMLQGMAQELWDMYQSVSFTEAVKQGFWGAGNGLRKNVWLCRILEDRFSARLTLSESCEEASRGAAIYILNALKEVG